VSGEAILRAERLVKSLQRVGNAGEWEVARVLLELLWSRVEESKLRNAPLEDGTQANRTTRVSARTGYG